MKQTAQLKAWTYNSEVHVHADGCKDTQKGKYRRMESPFNVVGGSKKEVVADIYPPDQYDWDSEDDWEFYGEGVKVYPCTGIK